MAVENTIKATSTGGPPPGLGFVRSARWAVKNPPSDPTISFAGKTILVTGANTGLGFEAALKYALLDAEHLILAVRSVQKGEAAKQRILQQCPSTKTLITVMEIDQSDFASVQAFVKNLTASVSRLDAALLNAGLANPKYVKSPAGWDMPVHVNVLSTALLAILLLPLLRESSAHGPKAHLTFVNSNGHTLVKPSSLAPGESLLKLANDEAKWTAESSYMIVKLLGMAVMQALARAAGDEVIVNAVCPGLCKTELGREFGWGMQVLMGVQQVFLSKTAEEGARSLVSATVLGRESHGRWWTNDVLTEMGELARDEELMGRTWGEILEVLIKVQGDLPRILNGE